MFKRVLCTISLIIIVINLSSCKNVDVVFEQKNNSTMSGKPVSVEIENAKNNFLTDLKHQIEDNLKEQLLLIQAPLGNERIACILGDRNDYNQTQISKSLKEYAKEMDLTVDCYFTNEHSQKDLLSQAVESDYNFICLYKMTDDGLKENLAKAHQNNIRVIEIGNNIDYDEIPIDCRVKINDDDIAYAYYVALLEKNLTNALFITNDTYNNRTLVNNIKKHIDIHKNDIKIEAINIRNHNTEELLDKINNNDFDAIICPNQKDISKLIELNKNNLNLYTYGFDEDISENIEKGQIDFTIFESNHYIGTALIHVCINENFGLRYKKDIDVPLVKINSQNIDKFKNFE